MCESSNGLVCFCEWAHWASRAPYCGQLLVICAQSPVRCALPLPPQPPQPRAFEAIQLIKSFLTREEKAETRVSAVCLGPPASSSAPQWRNLWVGSRNEVSAHFSPRPVKKIREPGSVQPAPSCTEETEPPLLLFLLVFFFQTGRFAAGWKKWLITLRDRRNVSWYTRRTRRCTL